MMKRSDEGGGRPLRVVMPQNGNLVFNYGSVMFNNTLSYGAGITWKNKARLGNYAETRKDGFLRKAFCMMVFFIVIYLPLL